KAWVTAKGAACWRAVVCVAGEQYKGALTARHDPNPQTANLGIANVVDFASALKALKVTVGKLPLVRACFGHRPSWQRRGNKMDAIQCRQTQCQDTQRWPKCKDFSDEL